MNLHEGIVLDIHQAIEALGAVDIISPTVIAQTLQKKYAGKKLEPRIEYSSLEHLKQMARRVLSGRYDAESDESEAVQGELFSGNLQRRYPVPHKSGDDPTYKLLEALTDDELRWNVRTLERSANARLLHARALEAWRQSRSEAA